MPTLYIPSLCNNIGKVNLGSISEIKRKQHLEKRKFEIATFQPLTFAPPS